MNRTTSSICLLLLLCIASFASAQADTAIFKTFIDEQVLQPLGKRLGDFDASTQIQLILFAYYHQRNIPGSDDGEHREVLTELGENLQNDFIRLISLAALSGERFDVRDLERATGRYIEHPETARNLTRLTGVTVASIPSFYDYYRRQSAQTAQRLSASGDLFASTAGSSTGTGSNRSSASGSMPSSWRGLLNSLSTQEEKAALDAAAIMDLVSHAFMNHDEEYLLHLTIGDVHELYVQSFKRDNYWQEILRLGHMHESWIVQAGNKVHENEYAVPVWVVSNQAGAYNAEFRVQLVQGSWKVAKSIPENQASIKLGDSAFRNRDEIMDVVDRFLISLAGRDTATARGLTTGPMAGKFSAFAGSARERQRVAAYVESMGFDYVGTTFDRDLSIAVSTLISGKPPQPTTTLRFIMVKRAGAWRIFGTLTESSIELFNRTSSS